MAQRETRNKRQKKKARFGLSSWQRIWLPPTSGWTRIWINGWSGIHSHRGRDRANAHGVDDERIGKCDLWARHAEAGTQRLQRAFQHQGWESEVIEEVLWQQAEMSRKEMQQRGETPLCIWVSLVLEKPESEKLEGLGAVRSSRVRRLARRRKGVFNQPSRMPVSVRGFEWESLLLVGQSGVPQVVAMRVVETGK